MALIKMKPTSPGTRTVIKVDRSHLHKGGPYMPLTAAQSKTGARNAMGRITTRHVGGRRPKTGGWLLSIEWTVRSLASIKR